MGCHDKQLMRFEIAVSIGQQTVLVLLLIAGIAAHTSELTTGMQMVCVLSNNNSLLYRVSVCFQAEETFDTIAADCT